MDWTVRKAKLEDVEKIVKLSNIQPYALMPYTLNWITVKGYMDQFLVAERPVVQTMSVDEPASISCGIGGAVHFIPNDDTDMLTKDKVVSFLEYIKQVPSDIQEDFMSIQGGYKIAFIGQVICPGKGSFYAILEEAKKKYDEIWCWMSIVGPSFKSYQRYGFDLNMEDVREFWNVYKCGYSKFVLGKWKKEENV